MNVKKQVLRVAAVCVAFSPFFANPVNAQSEGDIDRSATLRYTFSTAPADLDPPFAKNPFQVMGYVLPIYDTLVRMDAKGGVVPSLATSWNFSDDGLILTMTLRDGVKFSDGSDLNAAVVVKSLVRTKTDPASLLAGQLASFESFEATNPSTVTLRLKQRDTAALYALSTGAGMIVSGKALDDGVKLGEEAPATGY